MPESIPVVLDSYALLAFLFREKGYAKVLELLEQAIDDKRRHIMSAVNWAEVRYTAERLGGAMHWPAVERRIAGLPIDIIPADKGLADEAARFKAKGGISLADCFAAALAKRHGLRVCTGDKEFRKVEPEVKILWL